MDNPRTIHAGRERLFQGRREDDDAHGRVLGDTIKCCAVVKPISLYRRTLPQWRSTASPVDVAYSLFMAFTGGLLWGTAIRACGCV